MNYVHIFSLLFLIIGIYLYSANFREKQTVRPIPIFKDYAFWGSLILIFAVKLYFAASYVGFETDINCFSSWSDRVVKVGIPNYYASGWCDYPPGYIYVLYGVGVLRNLFAPVARGALDLILLKLPAILCDMGAGILIYSMAKKKFSNRSSILLMALYLLNPAIVLTSSSWGQVDGILAFGLIAAIYLASNGKVHLSYVIFVLTVLLKWQALMFTPVLIYATISEIFLPKFDGKKLGKLCGWFFGSVALFFALAAPFGIPTVIKTMLDALSSYRFATVNAFNTYAALELNWKSLEELPLLAAWGTIAIFVLVAFSAYIYYCTDIKKRNLPDKDPSRFYFLGATIIFCMFMLSTKMHERYLFPALVLLLAAYIVRPQKEYFFFYMGLSLAQVYNIAYTLFYYDAGTYYEEAVYQRFLNYSMSVSWITVIIFVLYIVVAYKNYMKPNSYKRK